MTDTKTKILDAAEELFADRGFAATSLRDITTAAGVNLASVSYHFGGKLALLSSVLARRFEPVNRERLERLSELERRAGEEAVSVEDLLRAFFAPVTERLAEKGSGWAKFIQLVGRTHSDTSEEIRECFVGQFQEVANRFIAAFGKALPELAPEVLGFRMHFVVGAMAHSFVFCQQEGMPLVESVPEPDALLENLIEFASAGLRAPVKAAIT